jgi:hypothetical protein
LFEKRLKLDQFSDMPHDFLTSLHSNVIGVTVEQSLAKEKSEKQTATKEGVDPPVAKDDRHLTIGVSMSPKLRERAAIRAKTLGLPFSRYVQWCVEAELDGSSLGDRFKV